MRQTSVSPGHGISLPFFGLKMCGAYQCWVLGFALALAIASPIVVTLWFSRARRRREELALIAYSKILLKQAENWKAEGQRPEGD